MSSFEFKSVDDVGAEKLREIFVTEKWELKKEYNPFISKQNTHDLCDLYFPKGVLNRNEHSKCEGQKQSLYE